MSPSSGLGSYGGGGWVTSASAAPGTARSSAVRGRTTQTRRLALLSPRRFRADPMSRAPRMSLTLRMSLTSRRLGINTRRGTPVPRGVNVEVLLALLPFEWGRPRSPATTSNRGAGPPARVASSEDHSYDAVRANRPAEGCAISGRRVQGSSTRQRRPEMAGRVQGKNVILTGAAGGIGRAVGHALVRACVTRRGLLMFATILLA